MARVKRQVERGAAKAVVRHSARGMVGKAQRRPVRGGTLLTIGGLIGAAAAFGVVRAAR